MQVRASPAAVTSSSAARLQPSQGLLQGHWEADPTGPAASMHEIRPCSTGRATCDAGCTGYAPAGASKAFLDARAAGGQKLTVGDISICRAKHTSRLLASGRYPSPHRRGQPTWTGRDRRLRSTSGDRTTTTLLAPPSRTPTSTRSCPGPHRRPALGTRPRLPRPSSRPRPLQFLPRRPPWGPSGLLVPAPPGDGNNRPGTPSIRQPFTDT